ncbi:retrovirus-related Pol polyprotein from transposon 17.6 [Trichonephila clavipes]|nr:retrovirus-related Pol polyprotein from transposon 17.6 [Trichonephila clavipes]
MPKFNLKNDDISLFLELFERQAKVLQLPKDQWVTYLIGVLPVEGTHFGNHNDARNSGQMPELNFDKRKRLQCYECGSFNHLRPQCLNLKTQKVELCRIGVKSEGSLLDPYTSKGKVNGFRMSILRDTRVTVDVICQKYVERDRMKGEHVWVRHLLDDHMTCLPVAEVDIECDLGTERERESNIQSSGDRETLGSRVVYLG